MGHPQPPTDIETENTASKSIINVTAEQKIYRAIDMRFYLVRDKIRKNHFHLFWEEGNKDIAYYVTKNHPFWHHRTVIPIYLKPTKKK